MTFRLYTEALADGYPAEWHSTLKHLVREQAGHRCIRCLHPYRCGEKRANRGEWTPCDEQCRHTDKDGCIHALFRPGDGGGAYRPDGMDQRKWAKWSREHGMVIESSWRILTVHHLDGNKLNCRWWNLAALCQRCHLEIQGRVKLDRPYFLEHSEWFKPYAAGYYAWSRLGEDLDREQVMARLEELLAVGVRQFPEPLGSDR